MPAKKTKAHQNQKPKRRRINMTYEAPQAKEVFLIGDFNQWNTKSHPMKLNQGGIWEKTLMLYPGRYEYKFLQDGLWQVDPRNSDLCYNCFGTQNNVLIV